MINVSFHEQNQQKEIVEALEKLGYKPTDVDFFIWASYKGEEATFAFHLTSGKLLGFDGKPVPAVGCPLSSLEDQWNKLVKVPYNMFAK